MVYKYHCACCNQTLSSHDKECPKCGSHHIRSPISLWIFCITACLAVVLVFKLARVYTQDKLDTPGQHSFLEILKQAKNK